MIECVRRQSGPRLPSMVVVHFQNCTWRTSSMRAKRTRRWHISKSTSHTRRVQRGRDTCAGCEQTRGEDTPMLTCSGCHVARFCSADHQKMASKKAASGGSLTTGRHKDICGVLRKWRDVVKDGVSPDSCTAELMAFLQRENVRSPKDAEGAPEAVLS